MKANSEFNRVVFAGFVGGMAEVVWIGLYSVLFHHSISDLGSAITATVFGHSSHIANAPLLGLGIHLLLSLLLALSFGYLILPWVKRYTRKKSLTFVLSVLVLALVWKINFYILLPIWNPEFVMLVPLSVSLTSKLLFGIAMGTVLSRADHRQA